MELKELLGEELYKQIQAKIDEKNSTEADKLKHVRYTDLSEGKYVSKEKQRTYHDASSKVNIELVSCCKKCNNQVVVSKMEIVHHIT